MSLAEFVRTSLVCSVAAGALGATLPSAHALDQSIIGNPNEVPVEKRDPWAVFRLGFSAYQSGKKEQAVEAYRYAADNGQVGARWKLARMYAEGDGVAQNDYQAFRFYREIISQDVEPGSRDENYVADALVALAGYVRAGIPGTPVQPDPNAAQDYLRTAANFGYPTAQFELGKMFLKGEGGVKTNVQQAGRWLHLAAKNGHAGAQATLGNLLFQGGQAVRGLAMMTAALDRAEPTEKPWIRSMQEEAFALTGEGDRRTAIALAQDLIAQGQTD